MKKNVIIVLKNDMSIRTKKFKKRMKANNFDVVLIEDNSLDLRKKDELLEELKYRDEQYVVFVNPAYDYTEYFEDMLINIGRRAIYEAVIFGTTKSRIIMDVSKNLVGIENIVFLKSVLFENAEYNAFFDNFRGLVGFNALKLFFENNKLGFVEQSLFTADELQVVDNKQVFDDEHLIYNNFLKKHKLFQLRNYEKLRINNVYYNYDAVVGKRDERLKDIDLRIMYKGATQTFVAYFPKYEFTPKKFLFYICVKKNGKVLDIMNLKVFEEEDNIIKVAKKRYEENNTFSSLTDGEKYQYILLSYNIQKMSYTEIAEKIGKHKEVMQ